MKAKGYYVWCRNNEGRFLTKFLPTTDYNAVKKYFEEHSELEYLANTIDERIFIESEKNELFHQMLELNNL